MPDEKPPETKVTDRLFATYISPDRKVLDMDSFKAAKGAGDLDFAHGRLAIL